jgi:hypothetical protein
MTWTLRDYTEWMNERAAIYEFDGGLSREAAERKAYQDLERLKQSHRVACDAESSQD